MLQQLILYWNICVFQASPSRLVGDRLVFAVLLGIAVLLTVFASLMSTGQIEARYLITSLTTVFLMLGAIYGVLYVRQFKNRFMQTICAYIGTGIIQDVVFLCLLSLQMQQIRQFGILAVSIWRVGVVGFILHKSMEVSLLNGVLLSFGLSLLSYILIALSIGVPESMTAQPAANS